MTTNWKDLARASLEGSESGTRLAVRDAKISAKQNDEGLYGGAIGRKAG